MYTIEVRNVNEAFRYGIPLVRDFGFLVSPRGKQTLEMAEPVSTVYHKPTERVLFCKERDANPFLHFFESLWMLAGRRDLAFMEKLTKNFRQFSDDGTNLQGSYGYKWRKQFGHDQIWELIQLLRRDPDTRRAVLTMWHPDDLSREVSLAPSSDIPCNTNVYFKIRDGELRMTVCNRSNDMLLGAYGANVVHMSLLQEYIANKVGVRVGSYTQMSDSFHVYLGEMWERLKYLNADRLNLNLYQFFRPTPIGAETQDWDVDLVQFFHDVDCNIRPHHSHYLTNWFKTTVLPLWWGFTNRDKNLIQECASEDWKIAATDWLDRRVK